MRRGDPAAELHRANVVEIGVFRKMRQQGASEDRQIARRSHLPFVRQTIGIHPMRLGHAERGGSAVHLSGEPLDRSADALGDRHGDVVCGFHHQHNQRIAQRHLGAGAEPHLGGGHSGRSRGDLQRRVHGHASRTHGVQRDVGGHQFCQRGGIPRGRRLFLRQNLTRGNVHHQRGRCARAGRAQDATQ